MELSVTRSSGTGSGVLELISDAELGCGFLKWKAVFLCMLKELVL